MLALGCRLHSADAICCEEPRHDTLFFSNSIILLKAINNNSLRTISRGCDTEIPALL